MKGCYRVGDLGLLQLAALTTLHRLNLHGCWQITAAGLAQLSGELTAVQVLPVCTALTCMAAGRFLLLAWHNSQVSWLVLSGCSACPAFTYIALACRKSIESHLALSLILITPLVAWLMQCTPSL